MCSVGNANTGFGQTAAEKNLDTLFQAEHKVKGPFLFALPLVASGTVLGMFGALDVAACFPQPGVWISCPAALGVTLIGGAGIVYFDYQYLRNAGSTWKSLTQPESTSQSDSGC